MRLSFTSGSSHHLSDHRWGGSPVLQHTKTPQLLPPYTRYKVILTMSRSLLTQEGSTLCCSVRCKEREDLHACRFWHRGHNHSDTPLLSLLAVSPDSSCEKKKTNQASLSSSKSRPFNCQSALHALEELLTVTIHICIIETATRVNFTLLYVTYCTLVTAKDNGEWGVREETTDETACSHLFTNSIIHICLASVLFNVFWFPYFVLLKTHTFTVSVQ